MQQGERVFLRVCIICEPEERNLAQKEDRDQGRRLRWHQDQACNKYHHFAAETDQWPQLFLRAKVVPQRGL